VGLSVVSTAKVVEYLKEPLDPTFSKFYLPPGRSSVFKGQKGITIIDSTYNATFDGMRAMLDFFSRYSDALLNDQERWLVLGDMIEQGKSELEEHRLLADMVIKADPKRVILVGPRLTTITYPILLKKYGRERVVSYMMPGEALSYLEKELKGGELVLFKGARYLEGAVEKLLHDPGDAAKLCRREDIWIRRRKQWGV
jgi:UDP-N-acetylmuramoyl-tripeptide--D-alanyl-D-alanine ligase